MTSGLPVGPVPEILEVVAEKSQRGFLQQGLEKSLTSWQLGGRLVYLGHLLNNVRSDHMI